MIDLRAKAKELELLSAECTVYLTEARVKYIADFQCLDLTTGEEFYIEAKGHPSPRWPVIKQLWSVYGPGRLEIWGGTYKNPVLIETLIPSGIQTVEEKDDDTL